MGRLARANAARRERANSESAQDRAAVADRCECGGDHQSNPAHWEAEDVPTRPATPDESPTSWKVGHMTVRVDKP